MFALLCVCLAAPPELTDEQRFDKWLAAKQIEAKPNKLSFNSFRSPPDVGSVGECDQPVVVQVINKDEAIMKLTFSFGGDPYGVNPLRFYDVPVYFRGVSMKDQSDGSVYSGKLPTMECTGTHTYKGTDGASKTVKLLVPLDEKKLEEPYRKWIKKRQDAFDAAQKKADEEKAAADKQSKEHADAVAKMKADKKREADADSKLSGAKFLYDNGKKDKAKERLAEIVKDFAGTKAAKEAETLQKQWASMP